MKKIIIRYLKGELNEEEKKELIEWLNASKKNLEYYKELEETWYAAFMADNEMFNSHKAWKRFKTAHLWKAGRTSAYHFIRYAAFIFLFIGLGWGGHLLYTNFSEGESISYMELSVPKGETANFKFSDRTRVQLNAGSSIQFPEHFGKEKREVYLEGEAYFQVTENQQRPFIVHAGELDLQVLGTAFNVKSYPDENIVETTLAEGKVRITKNGDTRKNGKGCILEKGQHLAYDKMTEDFQLNKDVNIELYTSWTQGRYKFQGIQLMRLAKSIERLYGVQIKIEDPELRDLTYSGSFYKGEPVIKVLKMIELSALEVEITQIHENKFLITQKKD